MNFLAHSRIAHQVHPPFASEPFYTVGAVLPDLLPLADRHLRIRLSNLPQTPDDTALCSGVRIHLATDAAFHRVPAFASVQAEIGQQIRDAGFRGIRVRRFFLAHILTEMALDAVLLRSDQDLADRFYQDFAAADPDSVTAWTEKTVGRPAPGLAGVLRRFVQYRYLHSYRTDEGVAEGIQNLCARARQDTFDGANRARLLALAGHGIHTVARAAESLVDQTVQALGETYPPTTAK